MKRTTRTKSTNEKAIADVLYDICLCGDIGKACKKNGVPRTNWYTWRRNYRDLSRAQSSAIGQYKVSKRNPAITDMPSKKEHMPHDTIRAFIIVSFLIIFGGIGFAYTLSLIIQQYGR